MANSTGWEILCPMAFTAEWNGGRNQADITFKADYPHPDFDDFIKSHFSEGVITFHPGYLFRTPNRWSMWVCGPPNHIKDGIQPLTALVETDWLPFPFTMNWIFTRPGRVRFEKKEPFCFITLMQDKPLEEFNVVQRSLEGNRGAPRTSMTPGPTAAASSTSACATATPKPCGEAWQRFYFRGEMPDDTGPRPGRARQQAAAETPQAGLSAALRSAAEGAPCQIAGASAISRLSFLRDPACGVGARA